MAVSGTSVQTNNFSIYKDIITSIITKVSAPFMYICVCPTCIPMTTHNCFVRDFVTYVPHLERIDPPCAIPLLFGRFSPIRSFNRHPGMNKNVLVKFIEINTFCQVIPQDFYTFDFIKHIVIIPIYISSDAVPNGVFVHSAEIEDCLKSAIRNVILIELTTFHAAL